MRYITAEQFKGQPEEVQKVFMNWWEPSDYDLISRNIGELGDIILTLQGNDTVRLKEVLRNGSTVPLFSIQQLWEFIEDKTNYPITVSFLTDEYWIDTDDGWSGDEKCFYDEDKLQAFWKCACEVARIMK